MIYFADFVLYFHRLMAIKVLQIIEYVGTKNVKNAFQKLACMYVIVAMLAVAFEGNKITLDVLFAIIQFVQFVEVHVQKNHRLC